VTGICLSLCKKHKKNKKYLFISNLGFYFYFLRGGNYYFGVDLIFFSVYLHVNDYIFIIYFFNQKINYLITFLIVLVNGCYKKTRDGNISGLL